MVKPGVRVHTDGIRVVLLDMVGRVAGDKLVQQLWGQSAREPRHHLHAGSNEMRADGREALDRPRSRVALVVSHES